MIAPAEPGGLILIVDDDPDARDMLRARPRPVPG